eukprot:TRINITY_DN34194_c0_g1_i4.p1 TRINITY_DN34194_c0_g1~~TRINITY_DN34194_c0_g1_i4.p1  ORF type:complete len:531 (-),score=140.35 TRINITY_DN34194_c0_g1_i4:116-1708(-)
MSQDQSKSLLQQISKDHYEQTEPKTADIQEEEKPDTVSRQTTFSDGYQTDSSLSPSIPFISAVQSPCSSLPPLKQSPTPSVSDWQDASSEILSDKDNIDDVDGDLASKYPLVNFGLSKRKLSRGQSGSQRSKKMPNIEDIEFPSLDYGPHLRLFQEEDGETPGENDLFPSTPLDEDQLPHADSKFKEELGSVVINEIEDNPELQWSDIGWLDPRWLDPRWLPRSNAVENAEVFAMNVWQKFQSWKVVGYSNLPQFLQDNDFLKKGHRPPLPNLTECFKSIFRIHTETGNIWTHLLGSVAFIGLSIFFMTRPSTEIDHHEKAVFMTFFAGAIVCMGFSFTYHTVNCHKNKFIGQLFVKFDYCGIAFLTVGSFVPWLYYSFYCNYTPKVVYMSITTMLGVMAVIVSLWDKFGTPRYRPYRACVFIVFGLSGIAPATHYAIQNGWEKSINEAAMGWLVFMGFLYITGTLLYAFRIPERFFPGKVDILFHSHQIFHCFVIAGAFVHYHGISNMALYRLQIGECPLPPVDLSQFA